VNAIVCVDVNWAIAKNGKQIIAIPEDRKHFEDLTKDASLVMGREIYMDCVKSGVVKEHDCYVLTSDEMDVSDAFACSSVWDLLEVAPTDAWVVGGESIYKQLFSQVDKCFVTMVYNFFNGDKFFPNLHVLREWEIVSRSKILFHENIPFAYFEYRRVK